MKNKFPVKRWTIKSIIVFLLFISFFVTCLFTKLPQLFDSYVYYDSFKIEAWLSLIGYRITMYILFPFIISIFEWAKTKRKFIKILLESFNVEFFVYGLISFIYVLFGVDKILGTSIFDSSDAFMLITGFVFCIILNKSIPDLINTGENNSL